MKPFDSSALSDPAPLTVEESTAEGMMLAEYASKMSLKNRIEVEAIGAGESFDTDRYVDEARTLLAALADEADAAAHRMVAERRASAYLDGRADHVHDYRSADVDNLEHREEASRLLATRLRSLRDDGAWLGDLVVRARDDAWREISAAIEASLDASNIPVDAEYLRTRAQRMKLLVAEDLAELWTGQRE